jgi:AraC family ethanolamine operon transcriptional activator
MGTIKSENCNRATIKRDGRERLMLLQTLSTRDFDELAGAFPGWDLRLRQLGRGPFRGRLQFLQLDGVQVLRLAVNRLIHIEGCPPLGCFGCFPVLAPNEKAVWGGRRLKAGQVRVFNLNQTADHVTAPDQYQLVALVVEGDLFRKEVSVLGGFDAEQRLAGREAITTSPAWCRALWSQLVGWLDLAGTRHALRVPWGQLLERNCFRSFAELLARPDDGRTDCQPCQRARVVRRADEYMLAHLRNPLSVLDLCREVAVSERTLHYAFWEVRGLSPMAYFKASRLNAVRRELKAAPAGTASVHEIARRWGFWHSGEFAAAYRRLFGELPSQTLNG